MVDGTTATSMKELAKVPDTDVAVFFEAVGRAIGSSEAVEMCKGISHTPMA